MIGEYLSKMMEKRRISLTELSKASGIPVSNLSQFKSNKSTPSLKVFIKLTDTLICSADELLGKS